MLRGFRFTQKMPCHRFKSRIDPENNLMLPNYFRWDTSKFLYAQTTSTIDCCLVMDKNIKSQSMWVAGEENVEARERGKVKKSLGFSRRSLPWVTAPSPPLGDRVLSCATSIIHHRPAMNSSPAPLHLHLWITKKETGWEDGVTVHSQWSSDEQLLNEGILVLV